MDSVTFENFRCFRERQTVRLAPLTLLVGENSTGKTSFLAMLRILAQLQEGETSIDFKEPPYDLGSFDDIAHNRGGRGGRASEFTVGLGVQGRLPKGVRRSRQIHAARSTRFARTVPLLNSFGVGCRSGMPLSRRNAPSTGLTARSCVHRPGAWVLNAPWERYGRSRLGEFWFSLDRPHRYPRFENDPAVPARSETDR